MNINIWANAPDVPGIVCADARLTDRANSGIFGREISRRNQTYGQASWHIGINYRTAADLGNKLHSIALPDYLSPRGRNIRRGEVRRLAINTHGLPGQIFINGQSGLPLTARNVRSMHSELHRIGLATPDDASNPAVILFVGCLAAEGPAGSELLLALTRIWPNRKIVLFASIGFIDADKMMRSGQFCTEPGMRDTNAYKPNEANRTVGKYWNDLTNWPWASEHSLRAKVAINGRIVRGSTL